MRLHEAWKRRQTEENMFQHSSFIEVGLRSGSVVLVSSVQTYLNHVFGVFSVPSRIQHAKVYVQTKI